MAITFTPHTVAEHAALDEAIHDAVDTAMHTTTPYKGARPTTEESEAEADRILANAGYDPEGQRLSEVIPPTVWPPIVEHEGLCRTCLLKPQKRRKVETGGTPSEAPSDRFGRLTIEEINEIGGFTVTYGNWYGMPKPSSYR